MARVNPKQVQCTITMKKTPLRAKSKLSISKIQRQIWEEVKRIVRRDYPHVCYTCGKSCEGSNLHTGHMWAKASLGAYLKYDLRLLRPQCYFCNINCGGQGAIFYKKMLDEKGKKYMEQLERDKQVTVKAIDHYITILEEYKSL